MLCGIFAGIAWALETVILGMALSMTPFVSDAQAIFLAPFVSTFLHDALSALYLFCVNGCKGRLKAIFGICKTRTFPLLLVSSAIGGPIGMTGYVLAVNYMGASVGAVASAIYPAIGAVLAYLFLKEKIRWYQWIFLLCTLLGVWGLSASPDLAIKNFGIGLLGVFMCSFGWGTEGVILSKMYARKRHYKRRCATSASACFGVDLRPYPSSLPKGLALYRRLILGIRHSGSCDDCRGGVFCNSFLLIILSGNRGTRYGQSHGVKHHLHGLGDVLFRGAVA